MARDLEAWSASAPWCCRHLARPGTPLCAAPRARDEWRGGSGLYSAMGGGYRRDRRDHRPVSRLRARRDGAQGRAGPRDLLDEVATHYTWPARRSHDSTTFALAFARMAGVARYAIWLDNALRYARAGRPELVRASGAARIEPRPRPGIPPEEAERLKCPFTRLDAGAQRRAPASLPCRGAAAHGGRSRAWGHSTRGGHANIGGLPARQRARGFTSTTAPS